MYYFCFSFYSQLNTFDKIFMLQFLNFCAHVFFSFRNGVISFLLDVFVLNTLLLSMFSSQQVQQWLIHHFVSLDQDLQVTCLFPMLYSSVLYCGVETSEVLSCIIYCPLLQKNLFFKNKNSKLLIFRKNGFIVIPLYSVPLKRLKSSFSLLRIQL